MSRIGKLPIEIPAGVNVKVESGNVVTVKGPLGELFQTVDPEMEVLIEDNQIQVNRPSDSKKHKALHGLYRSLVNNMVEGVSKGYEIKLELVGVGFRAENNGQLLDLVLGYSHHIYLQLPPEV